MFSKDLIGKMDDLAFAIVAITKSEEITRDDADALDLLIERLVRVRKNYSGSVASTFNMLEMAYFDECISDYLCANQKFKAFYENLSENGTKVFCNEVYHNYQSCAGEETFPFMENAIEATIEDMVDFDENNPNWARVID